MVSAVKMFLFVFLCCHSCMLPESCLRASTELCNKPEIKTKCLILHVSALLAILELFLEFYCQAA